MLDSILIGRDCRVGSIVYAAEMTAVSGVEWESDFLLRNDYGEAKFGIMLIRYGPVKCWITRCHHQNLIKVLTQHD